MTGSAAGTAHDPAARPGGVRPPAGADAQGPAPALDGAALDRLTSPASLLALFDIDGTLAPIAPRPEDAAVPPGTREALVRLTTRPGVQLGFVTGRAPDDGARLADVPGAWVIGNHGVETVEPGGARHLDPAALPFAEPLARAAERLRTVARSVPGARLEDKGWSLSLHYRLAARDAVPLLEAAARAAAEAEGLRLGAGKEVLELKIPAEIDKGTAILALAARLGVDREGALLFVGDDATDEDAFRRLRALPGALTVRVGPPEAPTHAAHRVDDPAAVRALVERLVTLRGG